MYYFPIPELYTAIMYYKAITQVGFANRDRLHSDLYVTCVNENVLVLGNVTDMLCTSHLHQQQQETLYVKQLTQQNGFASSCVCSAVCSKALLHC